MFLQFVEKYTRAPSKGAAVALKEFGVVFRCLKLVIYNVGPGHPLVRVLVSKRPQMTGGWNPKTTLWRYFGC